MQPSPASPELPLNEGARQLEGPRVVHTTGLIGLMRCSEASARSGAT